MPNQRKKGKKVVGVWLDEKERAELKNISEKSGMSVTDIIRQAIAFHSKSKGTKNENEKEN